MSPISQGLPPLPEPDTITFISMSGVKYPLWAERKMREYGDARADHARRVALNAAVAICRAVAVQEIKNSSLDYRTAREIGATVCANNIKELI